MATMALAAVGLATAPAEALQCRVGTITFYEDTGIKSCEIEADHRFRTPRDRAIACKGGAMLTQYADGKLESCTLAAAYDDDGRDCAADRRVTLDAGGAILACE